MDVVLESLSQPLIPIHLPAQVDSTFCELNPIGRGTNLQLLFTLLNTKPAAPRPAASEEGCAGQRLVMAHALFKCSLIAACQAVIPHATWLSHLTLQATPPISISHPFSPCLFRSEGDEARPQRRGPSLEVDSQLRVNLIIALGDLALRFPNTVEPYTGGWRRLGVLVCGCAGALLALLVRGVEQRAAHVEACSLVHAPRMPRPFACVQSAP